MSMREAGDSAGAAGFGAVLDESWAKRLAEPSPIALAISRIRPSEVNGRECMRLSSATTGKSNKTGKQFNKHGRAPRTWLGSNSISRHTNQDVRCKTSTTGNLQHISYPDYLNFQHLNGGNGRGVNV